MKSFRLLAASFLFVFGGLSAAAHAACSADFVGNCDWSNPSYADCAFSATYSCGNASGQSYSWDFGDTNTGSGLLVYNTYANPGANGAFDVTFTLVCSDSCTQSVTRRVCFTLGGFGCIQPNQGWN